MSNIINKKFSVGGMTCAACQANVTKTVTNLNGVKEVNVNLLSGNMTVSFDSNLIDSEKIRKAVMSIGYSVNEFDNDKKENGIESEWNKRKNQVKDEINKTKIRLISSICILLPLMYVSMGKMLNLALPNFLIGTENALIFAFVQFLLSLSILIINNKFFRVGFKSLIKGVPNMDTLIAIGASASFVYGIFAIFIMSYGMGHNQINKVNEYLHQLYFDSGAMIVTLVTLGKFLESLSKSKTTSSIDKLISIIPKTATCLIDGKEVVVNAKDIKKGDIIVIKPGETVAVDGTIKDGYGYLDESSITGESIPVEKTVGDKVISGSINKNGSFCFVAESVGEETSLYRIIKMVDEASNSKAPIARLADKVSSIFVPTVITLSVITFVIWMIITANFENSLSKAIAVLVVSCPCALGLATPVAIMVGIGKSAEFGVLVKQSESLEILSAIDIVVFDKTGTITEGKPIVTDIEILDVSFSQEEFMSYAYGLEKGSEHPFANAICEKAIEMKVDPIKVDEFKAIFGKGVFAKVKGETLLAGNTLFLQENGVNIDEKLLNKYSKEGKTPLIFAFNNKLIGIIAIADKVRADSNEAIKEIKKLGIETLMLTGDNLKTAEAVQLQTNIDKVIANVLPDKKANVLKELMDSGKKVVMVGDGVNDSVALTTANVGIAIGAGTDIAIDSADVILIKNSLNDVVTAIKFSKKVVRNIKTNLFWAFFYNVLGIPIAAGVLLPICGIEMSPMIGALAMSVSSLFVVINALRLRFFKIKDRLEKGKQMKKVMYIDGMMCKHCQATVEKLISQVKNVESVEVNLKKKTATMLLSAEVDENYLVEIIKEAGFEPKKFKNM